MRKNQRKSVFTVQSEQTIISFLKKTFSRTPLSLIYKLFRMKKVTLQGKQLRYYQHRVKAGLTIEINDEEFLKKWNSESQKTRVTKQKIVPPLVNSVILYEDENILIVIKEHNVEMHSETNKERTLDNEIAYYLTNAGYPVNDHLFVFSSVHRIDKLTRGIVVYPKNSLSKVILHSSFEKKELIRKSYLAACENNARKKVPNYIDGYIYKEETQERMIFSPLKNERKKAKFCSMQVIELFSNPSFLLLEVILGTGRKHQIRSTLNYLGLPIIGDKKYGSMIPLQNKIKLFAYRLEFLNLPNPLSYLNGKIFEINKLREKLTSQLASSSGFVLPKKFVKY